MQFSRLQLINLSNISFSFAKIFFSLLLVFGFTTFLLKSNVAMAANFTVNSTADTSDAVLGDGFCDIGGSVCTLRAAIEEGDFLVGPHTITLPAGTYNITSLLIPAAENTINGAGSGTTVITNTSGTTGVFAPGNNLTLNDLAISNNATISPQSGAAIDNTGGVTITINNCTFHNNSVISANGDIYGGAIYNASGTLNITDSVFSNNTATSQIGGDNAFGGAIYNEGGTVTITGSTFSGNQAIKIAGNATIGAIANTNNGTMTITNTTFTNNTGATHTGAIGNISGTLEITDSTFTNNQTSLGDGGAIRITGGTATITNSTFTGNDSITLSGGAIQNAGATTTISRSTFSANEARHGGAVNNTGTMTITNSTFSGNLATRSGVSGYGGAINNSSNATLTLTHNTIVENTATTAGGGIDHAAGGAGVVTIKNNIITQNTHTGAVADECAGQGSAPAITSQGVNILSTVANANACTGWTGSDLTAVADPLLGALTVNAPGTTATMAVESGSPALDATANSVTATDQRGVSRPQGLGYDVGAYELAADLVITATDGQNPAVIAQALTYTVTVTNNSLITVNGIGVSDNNPAGLTPVSWTCSIVGGGSCSAGTSPATVAGNITGVTVDLDPGAVATFALSATVANGAASNIVYTATLTPPGGFTDGNGGNDAATDTNFVRPKLVEVTPVPTPAQDTTPSYTFSSTQAGSITYGGSCSSATANAVAGANTITFNALAAGATYNDCTIIVTEVPNGLDSNTIAITSFTITAGDTDVDIAIDNTDNQTIVSTNADLIYTVAITNNSAETVNNIEVTDTFPAGLTDVIWVCEITSGTGSCDNANGVGNIASELISLDTGATATFTINATVTAVAASDIITTASIVMPVTYNNTNVGNGTSTDTDEVRAHLAVVTAVTTPSQDTTPNFTFSSTQAGTITYGGSCTSNTNAAAIGNNQITFSALGAGATYNNCTITVHDQTNNNASNTLAVPSFTISNPPSGGGGGGSVILDNNDGKVVLTEFFTDIKGNWAAAQIESLRTQCNVLGYRDVQGNLRHLFMPNSNITRAELITMIVRCKYGEQPFPPQKPFEDVPLNHFGAPYIKFALEKGIVSGYQDGTFRPDIKINTAEALKIILLTWISAADIDGAKPNSDCPDVKSTEWFGKYYNYVLNGNIASNFMNAAGQMGNLCYPNDFISRAATAKLIINTKSVK